MLRAALLSVSALIALAASPIAFAQSDCKSIVKASPFGPNDQTGATNRVTPAVTKAAAAEIQTGKVTNMPRTPQPNDIAARLERIHALEGDAATMQRFGRYLDIIAPARLEGPELPARCTVESNGESLGVFGLAEGTTRWSDIAAVAREAPDQRWLKQLQECIWLASCGRLFQPVQAVYHGRRGSFQPHLAKREWQADGDVRYHVHLIETTVAPLADVQNDFGLLATLLRLGLRFRFEVIQRSEKALAALPKKKAVPPEALREVVRSCREALETIENDATSRGAQNMRPWSQPR